MASFSDRLVGSKQRVEAYRNAMLSSDVAPAGGWASQGGTYDNYLDSSAGVPRVVTSELNVPQGEDYEGFTDMGRDLVSGLRNGGNAMAFSNFNTLTNFTRAGGEAAWQTNVANRGTEQAIDKAHIATDPGSTFDQLFNKAAGAASAINGLGQRREWWG